MPRRRVAPGQRRRQGLQLSFSTTGLWVLGFTPEIAEIHYDKSKHDSCVAAECSWRIMPLGFTARKGGKTARRVGRHAAESLLRLKNRGAKILTTSVSLLNQSRRRVNFRSWQAAATRISAHRSFAHRISRPSANPFLRYTTQAVSLS
jgi:hypothetical protein